MSHVAETVYRLIGIGVQLGQGGLNFAEGSPLLDCVGHNGLNCSHFELILIKAVFNGSDETRDNTSTSIKSRDTNSTECGDGKTLHDGHVLADVESLGGQIAEGGILSDLSNTRETICSPLHLQGILESVHTGRGFLDCRQELLVVHLERDYPLVNSCHYLVTSFQAFFAILSNTGLIAGLM